MDRQRPSSSTPWWAGGLEVLVVGGEAVVRVEGGDADVGALADGAAAGGGATADDAVAATGAEAA